MRLARAALLGALIAAAASPAAGQAGGARKPDEKRGDLPAMPAQPWPVKTREHVDLWLHGFALLQEDSAKVPLFRRGYRDAMTVRKNQSNLVTLLDRNADKLRAGFATNRSLPEAQFLALYFGSWDDLRKTAEYFVRAEGDPRRASSREGAQGMALFAGIFQTPAERDWLKVFVESLQDEQDKFYHLYWLTQQRQRDTVVATVDSVWQKVYRPRLQNFLNNTTQISGDFILSLPLEGEGRTITFGKMQNVIALEFPDRAADAAEVVYVFAHEAMGQMAGAAVADNTTPNEKRLGVADKYTSAAQVRGGLMLLERAAPELAEGYARYYLRVAGVTNPVGAPKDALAAAFPLPDLLRDALARQLEIVMGGI